MKFVKGTMALAVAAVALGGASIASAGEIVTTWDYKVSAIWTSVTTVENGVETTDPAPDPQTLSWGVPATLNGQSSLEIVEPTVMGEVDTYQGFGFPTGSFFQPAITLEHDNFPIFEPLLTGATLQASLMLTAKEPDPPYGAGAADPNDNVVMLDPISYDIAFAETANFALPCASEPPDSNGNPCNDIFVQLTGVLDQEFDFMDNTYYVNILPAEGADLGTLTAAECAAVTGAPANCIGFTTPEGLETPLPFRFAVSTRPLNEVPEPALLALMGIGLAGAAAARRRKKA